MNWFNARFDSLKSIERQVWVILLVALVVRAAVSLVRPLDDISDDGEFYILLARQFVIEGYPFMGIPDGTYFHTAVGPVYAAFLSLFYSLFQGEAVLVAVRLVQIAADLLGVWLAYHIGSRLFGERAGLVTMAAIAIDVRFGIQASDPSTETLYIVLLLAGFALYLTAVESRRLWNFAWAGAVFGMATLTRPVPLLLPVALGTHALVVREYRAQLLKGVGVMALALWAVVTPWIIRNAVVTSGQFIPVSNVAASTFYMGSTGDGRYPGHEQFFIDRDEDFVNESDLNQTPSAEYVRFGIQNVLGDPLSYIGKRARNTLEAYLQPYGTVFFAGPSVKQTATAWLRGQATLNDVVTTSGFWPKLVMYVFHYSAVGLGLAGLALSWRRWREVLPLALMLAYGTGVYALLLIIPRYLFPLTPFYWIAAGYALVWLWDRIRQRRRVRATRDHVASEAESR